MIDFCYDVKAYCLLVIHKVRRFLGIKLDESKVPYSPCYCYDKNGCCPYWHWMRNQHAFCSLEARVNDTYLFDQVSICNVNRCYDPKDVASNYNVYIGWSCELDLNGSSDRMLLDKSVLRVNCLDERK